jgi:hypothetical protein
MRVYPAKLLIKRGFVGYIQISSIFVTDFVLNEGFDNE